MMDVQTLPLFRAMDNEIMADVPDPLWSAWMTASEAEQRAFLDRNRRRFLSHTKLPGQ